MIVLTTLGSSTIEIGDHRLTPSAERTFAAILYMAAERGRPVPRAVLQELLFATNGSKKAGHSLRQLVYGIRKLGVPIEGDGTQVSLDPEVISDSVACALRGGPIPDETLRLMAGGYLPGYQPTFSEPFSDWLATHRTTVVASLLRVLGNELRAARLGMEWPRCEAIARACLGLDPMHEEATLVLAESIAATGSKAQAVGVLDRLIGELGERPAELTIQPSLLRKRISERIPDSYASNEIPLIGRERELEQVTRFLTAPNDSPASMLILSGEAGIGKSRLLDRAAKMATIQGMTVVRVAMQPYHANQPLAFFVEAVPKLLQLRGALGCSPRSLEYLTILANGADEQETQVADAELRFAQTLTALDDLVDSIASETRLAILIEDAHDIDELSARILSAIYSKRGSRGVLSIAAARAGGAAHGILSDCDRSELLELEGLHGDGANQLIDALASLRQLRVDDDLRAWWREVANGNPLFLSTLVLQGDARHDRYAIPPTLTSMMARKLRKLTPNARLAFEACSIRGGETSVTALATLTALDERDVIRALTELQAHRLIRVVADSVEPVHRLIADAVISTASETTLLRLHKSAAHFIDSGTIGDVSDKLSAASHWKASGDRANERSVLAACAHQLMAVGRPAEACSMFQSAADMTDNPDARLGLLLKALDSAVSASRWGTALAILKQIEPLTDGPSDVRIRLLRVEAAVFSGDYDAGLRELPRLAEDESAPSEIRLTACRHRLNLAALLWDREMGDATAKVARSISIDCDEADDQLQQIDMIYDVVFGDMDKGRAMASEVYLRNQHEQPTSKWGKRLSNVSLALHRAGDSNRAIDVLEHAGARLEATGLVDTAFGVWGRLVEILLDLGRLEEAAIQDARMQALATRSIDRVFATGVASNTLRLALATGRIGKATELLADIKRSFAGAAFGANYWFTLAMEAFLLRHTAGSAVAMLPLLREGTRRGTGFSGSDLLAAECIWALCDDGMPQEALELARGFLVHRRDMYPVPLDLVHAIQRAETEGLKSTPT